MGSQQWIHTESPYINLNSTTVWTHVRQLNLHTLKSKNKQISKEELTFYTMQKNPHCVLPQPQQTCGERLSKTTLIFWSGSK